MSDEPTYVDQLEQSGGWEWRCLVCGVKVLDPTTHSAWHASLARPSEVSGKDHQ